MTGRGRRKENWKKIKISMERGTRMDRKGEGEGD